MVVLVISFVLVQKSVTTAEKSTVITKKRLSSSSSESDESEEQRDRSYVQVKSIAVGGQFESWAKAKESLNIEPPRPPRPPRFSAVVPGIQVLLRQSQAQQQQIPVGGPRKSQRDRGRNDNNGNNLKTASATIRKARNLGKQQPKLAAYKKVIGTKTRS